MLTERTPTLTPCPLCGASDAIEHHRETEREYWRCQTCALVFLSPSQRLSREVELARYSQHRNSSEDPEYLRFLARLADPMAERVPEGAVGLDYGCGQSTALALLLSRTGRPTASYDPVFRPEDWLLKTQYDFVTCSEVMEHVHEPRALLDRFQSLIVPGGKLGVMTYFCEPAERFGEWWYRRDPTHVCFYDERTMRWIGDSYGWAVEIAAPNIAIFTVGGDRGVA